MLSCMHWLCHRSERGLLNCPGIYWPGSFHCKEWVLCSTFQCVWWVPSLPAFPLLAGSWTSDLCTFGNLWTWNCNKCRSLYLGRLYSCCYGNWSLSQMSVHTLQGRVTTPQETFKRLQWLPSDMPEPLKQGLRLSVQCLLWSNRSFLWNLWNVGSLYW